MSVNVFAYVAVIRATREPYLKIICKSSQKSRKNRLTFQRNHSILTKVVRKQLHEDRKAGYLPHLSTSKWLWVHKFEKFPILDFLLWVSGWSVLFTYFFWHWINQNHHISWGCTAISELMINEQIRDREVRLIGENGEQLGIMSAKDAYKLAKEAYRNY